jgi:hypothetical protein
MENTNDLADLIMDYGSTFYGCETPGYMASQWIRALPKADLSDFHEWFDRGFWSPDVAQTLSGAGVFPWEVPSDVAYDLCNGDLSVSLFLQTRRY